MNGVKLACGCAVVAIAVAGQLSHLTGSDVQGSRNAAGEIVGGRAAPAPVRAVAEVEAAKAPLTTGPSGAGGGFGIETIAPDRYGQFQTAVEIEGQRLPMLVDTGASFVTLSSEDADRLGLRPLPADFKYKSLTANGPAYSARVEIREIRLGQIDLHNVTAFVSGRGALAHSLLGMSFLSRLGGFRVEDGQLVLWR